MSYAANPHFSGGARCLAHCARSWWSGARAAVPSRELVRLLQGQGDPNDPAASDPRTCGGGLAPIRAKHGVRYTSLVGGYVVERPKGLGLTSWYAERVRR
jgi:hypothetical protein